MSARTYHRLRLCGINPLCPPLYYVRARARFGEQAMSRNDDVAIAMCFPDPWWALAHSSLGATGSPAVVRPAYGRMGKSILLEGGAQPHALEYDIRHVCMNYISPGGLSISAVWLWVSFRGWLGQPRCGGLFSLARLSGRCCLSRTPCESGWRRTISPSAACG